MQSHIGRFELRRELGRGSQSVVYLGFDPLLQREVAIKALHLGKSFSTANGSGREESLRLMAEARAVSKLCHPNIVPIFEAGEEGGDPYLVFEYVLGLNLDQLLREKGPLPPVRAAEVLQGILGALATAHEKGIVHRDLKPSNILIDESGLPRVMDFGISASVNSGETETNLLGTPAYMAPEYVLKGQVSPSCDLYAAGLILLELLSGRRAIKGDTVREILKRVVTEPVALPSDVVIDERLGNIILRACARDPLARFADAGQLQQALTAYLGQSQALGAAERADGWDEKKQSTMEFLLRRMRHKTDFPALSDSVKTINRITASEDEGANKLSEVLLNDFGLANRILRLSNSAYYRQAGAGQISTISRAAVVLGFDAIRNLATTAMLFEHLQDKANADKLKVAFMRANFAGSLAREICVRSMPADGEEAFLCALFHRLGQLLAVYYFPEEMEEIVKVKQRKKCTDDAAAANVLGIGFEDLGLGIARSWGFPKGIVASMRKMPKGASKKPVVREETMQVIACFSNELCDAIAMETSDERNRALNVVKQRFAKSLELSDEQLSDIMDKALVGMSQIATFLRINLQHSPFMRQAMTLTGGSRAHETARELLERPAAPGEDQDLLLPEAGAALDPEAILAAGIQDIMNSLAGDFSLKEVVRTTVETMYRGMGFQRVLLCMPDPQSRQMVGRFGFGSDAREVGPRFRFPLDAGPDVFQAALAEGRDTLVSDVDDPQLAASIPPWYVELLSAKTFMLLPLVSRGKPLALIYCDMENAGDMAISEQQLSLLKTLRNQALLAFKQAGSREP